MLPAMLLPIQNDIDEGVIIKVLKENKITYDSTNQSHRDILNMMTRGWITGLGYTDLWRMMIKMNSEDRQKIIKLEYMVDIPRGYFKDNNIICIAQLPEKTKTIGEDAFKGCTALQSLNFPDAIQKIDANAFDGCTALESVRFLPPITSSGEKQHVQELNIGNNAFQNCTNLTSVQFSNKMTQLGCFAFSNCTKLTSVKFGLDYTIFNGSAFFNCPPITVTFEGNQYKKCGASAPSLLPHQPA